jgi:hypothetical protein
MTEEFEQPTPREQLEQAALLPEHDPVRTRILQQLRMANGTGGNGSIHHDKDAPAGREWSALLDETARFKSALLKVPVPAGLEHRLLAIPDRVPVSTGSIWTRPVGEVLTPRRLTIAASVLILLTIGWFAYVGISASRQQRALENVATIAVDIHKTVAVRPPSEHIDTSDPSQAQAWLQPRLTFPANILAAPHMKLTSAGVVRLGDAPAALTRWENNGHVYTLLNFVPASLGLPADFPMRTTEDPTPGPTGQPSTIVMWAEPHYGCGWVLVMDKTAVNTFTHCR